MRPRTAVILALGLVAAQATAAPDRYSYFGGEVDAEEKNAAVEACEYRELVELRRCNERVNKSACIDAVHAACLREFGPDAEAGEDDEAQPRS